MRSRLGLAGAGMLAASSLEVGGAACSPDAWAPFALVCRGGPWVQAVLPSGICGLWLPGAGWQDGSLGAPVSGPCPPALGGAGLASRGRGWPTQAVLFAGREGTCAACRWVVAPERAGLGTHPPHPSQTLGRVTCVLGLPHLPFPEAGGAVTGSWGGRKATHIFSALVGHCSCTGVAWSRRW